VDIEMIGIPHKEFKDLVWKWSITVKMI
jgi:hypothetical protein